MVVNFTGIYTQDQKELINFNLAKIHNSRKNKEKTVRFDQIIKRIIKKKLDKFDGMKVNLNKYETIVFELINLDQYEKKIEYIYEADKLNKIFQYLLKPFDKFFYDTIVDIYKSFRISEELKNYRFEPNNWQWGMDEVAFLISEINEFIIKKLKKREYINKFIDNPDKYEQTYLTYTKNVIAIDEATDLSLLDIKCIFSFRHWVIHSVTLCGDIMQRMTNEGIRDWNDLEMLISPIHILKINKSYRLSPTLLKLASKIHKQITNKDAEYQAYLSKHVAEPKPLFYINENLKGRLKWILNRLQDVYKSYGESLPSTAIFVSSKNQINEITKNLNELKNVGNYSIISYNSDDNLNKKSNTAMVFSIDQIKGLEFEVAFFVDLQDISQHIDNQEQILRYIFIGLSRAAYYFAITGPEKFKGQLSFLNTALYTQKTDWK
ncbi:MAG: hypothetical protein WAT79_05260 [Saprospiraceae bacterium]